MEKKLFSRKKEKLFYFFVEAIIFLSVFSLAVFVAESIISFLKTENGYKIPQISLSEFLFSFAFFLALVLFFTFSPKLKKAKPVVYRILFVFSAIYGLLVILSVFLPVFWVLIISALILLLWSYFRSIIIHDILMIFTIAGISVPFGLSLGVKSIIILLVLFSFYDYIAVYKTKHMVKMAKSMMESGTVIAFYLPNKFRDFFLKTKDIEPGGRVLILGGGDVAFPLLFALSSLKINFLTSLIISIFAFIGVVFSNLIFLFQKEKEPIPALPPIALFSIIGYIIAILIIH